MSVARFRFEDCTVAVACRDAAVLRWLARFLECGFEPARAAGADHRVELVLDPEAYERLHRAGPRPGSPPVAGFAGDDGPRRFERWSGGGSADTFRDERSPVFYRVSDGGARVELVAREASRKVRTALMRVVRELAMGRVVATGGALVHGAAVRSGGGVVVMCGPKRSGKTTLLMAMLRVPGVRYVSNDRCVLRVGPGRAWARGLPTLVSLRSDTLHRFPGLRGRLKRIRPELDAPEHAGRVRFSLGPPEFCALLGAAVAPGGPLRALVFPRITAGAAGPSLRRLGAEEARGRFGTALFRARDDAILGDVFVPGPGAARRRAARDVAASLGGVVARDLACFEYTSGGERPPDPGEAAALLATLSAGTDRPVREDWLHA